MIMISLHHLVGLLTLGLSWAALSPTDPVVVGQTFLASSQDPTEGNVPWALTSHGIAERLFTVNKEGEIVSQIGRSVTKITDFLWDVEIQPNYKFSDGTTVDAEHVAFALMEQNRKNSNAMTPLGEMTVSVLEDLKVRIKSDNANHNMEAVLAHWAFTIYHKNSEGEFVFTGPFVVDSFSEEQIDLVPNQFYDDQVSKRPSKVQVKKFSDGDDLADNVRDKNVDIAFHLPIDRLTELRKIDGVHIKTFEVGYHYMMFYNIDRLQDVRVRKAIDLVIDRNALSQALGGGKGTRSLFPDNTPYYADESDPHGDKTEAEALLEEAGWILNSKNEREKDGKKLEITLVAYPHRPGLGIMQPIIAEAMEGVGITVEQIMTGQDWTETSTIMEDRTFDMLMWAQHTLPAGDPLWFLSSFFYSTGGSNHANIQSGTIDSLVDSLSLAEEPEQRKLMSQAAQEGIFQEVPVSNLVTPDWHIALSDRVQDYDPWGSDYYVIRSDLFVEVQVASGSADLRHGTAVSLLLSVVGLFVLGWGH